MFGSYLVRVAVAVYLLFLQFAWSECVRCLIMYRLELEARSMECVDTLNPLLPAPSVSAELCSLASWMIAVEGAIAQLRTLVSMQQVLIRQLQIVLDEGGDGGVIAVEDEFVDAAMDPDLGSTRRRLEYSDDGKSSGGESETASWPTPATPKYPYGGTRRSTVVHSVPRSLREPSTTLSWTTPAKEGPQNPKRRRR